MKSRQIITICMAVIMLSAVMNASGQISVLTQHNDNARTGQNTNETSLNTSNVKQATFGKLFWRTVDGFIYAQPLYIQGLTIQGATHNVVYVATEHNSVYAFDADNPNEPAPLWQVNLGMPVPMQDICIITGDTNPGDCPYYDISPEIGITSTPVIDPTAGVIYLVNRTKNTSNNTYHDYLHALSLTTGAEELGGPVEITAQVAGTGNGSQGGVVTFDPTYHHQRPALLLENGVLYLAFGSVGDIGTWHGWVMSYNASTLQQEAVFNVTPDGDEGGIWSSGQGPVADTNGFVYMMTGNGDFNANVQNGTDYGDSFIKFNGPSLAVTDYFTPSNQASLNSGNTDIGAGGPMLMPNTSLLVGQGKDSTFRVVNTTNMGKFNSSTDNDVQEFTATTGPLFSSPVYWNSPNFGPLVYIWGPNDVLKALQFTGSKFNTTPVTEGTIQNANHFSNAAALSVSSNGSLTGTGIVWTSSAISGKATGVPVPGAVRAFDATDLSTELWDSTQNLARDNVGNYAKFNAPTIANGKVYVGSFSGQLQVYGLNPPPFQGVQFVQVASATPQSTTASVPVTFSSAQKAGDLNVIIVGWNDTTASVQTVTDSAGNTYTRAFSPTAGTGLTESIYYAQNIAASSSNTVTVTFNVGASKPDIRILEYSGVATSSALDVGTGASGNSNIADSGFVTTNAANELIIGANMVSNNTTIMAGAPFNIETITSPNSDLAADRLVNVPGSYHSWAPLNASGPWVMQVVTFKSATTSSVPFVGSVSPNSGATAGGTSVTITGTNFANGDTVTFGSAAATNVVVVNSSTITATTPAGTAGAVTVTVTNSGGQSGSLTSGFTYVAPPTVSSVSPNSGSTSGGTAVTITGTNFASGDTVTFGSAAATNVVVVSTTTITATTPAGTAGAVTVKVTNSLGQSGSLTNGFTYVVRPTVTSVSPSGGAVAGGTAVTITGTNFAAGAAVTFGSAAATNVTVVNSTTITATTPAGSSGVVSVTVTVNGQSGGLTNGFTYGQPTVSSVSPNNGPTAGGTSVTITGTNFASSATVSFGSAAATNVTVVNSTTLTATTPAGSTGAVTVTVTNSGGQSGSLVSGFTYVVPAAITFVQVASSDPQTPTATVTVSYPGAQTLGDMNVVAVGWNDNTSTVKSVTDTAGNTYKLAIGPTSGTGVQQSIYYASNIAAGSNTVTVTFSQAAAFPDIRILEYKGVTTLDVTAASSGSSATASSGAATTTSASELIFGADIIATTTKAPGTGYTARIITSPDSDLAEDMFTTNAGSNTATSTLTSAGPWVMQMATFSGAPLPTPTVTSVSPNSGSTSGGTAVTITGTNFASGATVTFGSAAATNVVVVNSTTITATTPAGSAGATTVTVTVNGRSGSLASGFTYVVAPTVTSVSPNSGPVAGGTAVTITGTNFASGATVTFGSAAATNVVVVNSTTITATTPAGSAGAVTVTVTVNSQSGSLTNGFTYVATPTVMSVSPNSGSTSGGTTVTITGTNFASGATVTFASAAATNVVVVNSTTITATTPSGSAGAVTVTVTNTGNLSGSLTNGFTYVVKPTVMTVSPNSGPVAGGTSVTITGTNFASGATVTFGSAAATNVVVVNSSTITATTPAGSAGAVTVTVTVNGQSGSLTNGFTYIGQPTVTSVSPNNGPTTGGTSVTITGTNFASGATVTFGSAAATNVVVVSNTSITATTPAGSAGTVTVTVTNTGNLSGSLANGFTYNAAAAISYVQVASATPQTATATVSVSYPGAQTLGDMNIVVVGWNDTTATVKSVTDSAGNTYKQAIGPTSGTGLRQSIYYAPNIVAGSNTVTVTFSQAAAFPDIRILEYRGVNTLDVTAGASGSSTSASSGSATTTNANELIFGAETIATTTKAAGSGFTSRIITSPDSDLAEDKFVTTAGSNAATATLSSAGPWVMQMATFSAGTSSSSMVTGESSISGSTSGGTLAKSNGINLDAQSDRQASELVSNTPVAIGYVQVAAADPQGTAATVNVVYPAAQTQGNLNIVAVGWNDTTATVKSVTDSLGNTYQLAVGPTSRTGLTQSIYYAANIAGGTNSVTVTFSQAASFPDIRILEYQGVTALDATAGASGSSASPSSGSATTTGANELIFGAELNATTTKAAGSGFTARIITSPDSDLAEDETVTATGSYGATATLSTAGGWVMQMATFVAPTSSPPTVTAVSPSSGSTSGGTVVTITGTNFASGATVSFGSAAATNVSVVNSTTITATTPAGTAGAVTVTVKVNGQSGSLANGFTYVAGKPSVTSVSPNNGPTSGGTSVTITGTNFASGATVTFGSAAATNVVVVNSTTITATTPAGPAGPVTVMVTVNGQSDSLAGGFIYGAPIVGGVSPNNGPTAGGTTVTITGTNFASGATVTFGGTAATSVTVVSNTTITAKTPAGSAGAVTVTVSNPGGQNGSLLSGFTYVATPTVGSVSPNNGPTAGGTAVTINGNNFASGATVTFGSAAATSVVVVNSTTITATTPAGSGGPVAVTVTVSGLSGSLAGGFVYGSATVRSVSPNNGPTAGGTPVTITGTNFASGATATFGAAAATNVSVVSSTTITATTPAGSVGAVTVTVTNAGGMGGSLANGFTYNGSVGIGFVQVAAADPQSATSTVNVSYPGAQTQGDLNIVVVGWNDTSASVQSVTDSAGNTYQLAIGPTMRSGLRQSIYYAPNIVAGSNTVTATFSQAASFPDIRILEYRGVTALDVTAGASGSSASANSGSATTNSANELILGALTTTSNAKAAGSGFTARIITSPDQDLAEDKVVTAAGSNAATATLTASGGWVMQMATFAAVASAPPTITGVSPSSGSTAGGTAVTITGTNFASGATVTFGGTAATSVVVANSTTITAKTPAGAAGAVTVKVTNPSGQNGSLTSGFTYVVIPTVTSVTPNGGPTAGGTAVTIKGTNFVSGATVTFGGTAATSVVVTNSTTITAKTPAGSAGAVAVTVINPGGQSGSLATGFTYLLAPTVSSVSPNSGPTAGGTAVTISGTNFASGATVTFGSAAATSVVVVNSTTITAKTPAGSAGAVTVTVTVSGQGGSLASGFTYVVGPTVSSVTPSNGPLGGGTAVTITGTNFASGATVTFGGAAATNVSVVNSTTITATTPAGTAGAVTVTVTVSGQSGSLASGFTYIATPTVTSVSPNNGPTAGGTSVTITGTNFASGATVTFGGAAATNVSVVNSTTITATTPAGTAGAVTVTVTVSAQSGSLASGFTYNGSGGGTFSDNFDRANGSLGSNWTTPSTSPATLPLQIINDQVLAANTPAVHALEYYNAGTFANNQWASETVVNAPPTPSSSQAIQVRASNTNYYNDAVPATVSGSSYFVGVANQTDFCDVGHVGQYANGDSHALYVAGSGPVFFWSFHNGVIDATCGDTVFNITGGNAGIGMAGDQNSTPTMAATNWQGGSLENFSSTPSDNFTRANAGWLGVNWWFTPIDRSAGSINAFYKLANNAAVLSSTGGSQFGAAIWTTPLSGNQSSVVTIGAYGSSGDFAGPVVRYSIPDSNNVNNTTAFYFAEAQSSGQVEIWEYGANNFNLIANLGTFGGTVSTLELDASGTSPVTLTVKVNGSTFGPPTVDSTYKLTGPYVGFTTFGTSSTTVTGWSGIGSLTVSSVSPNNGPTAGGTSVTITGGPFASGATVTFGGTAATNVTVVSSTSISATTPAGSAGPVTVSVTNPNGQSGSLAGGFTYGSPTVTMISPNNGSTVGGTAVTITGTNFVSGAAVTFGGTAATNVTVVGSTSITATTPAGTAGAVTVTVTNPGGQGGSLSNGYTYVATPTVSSVSPNNGPTAGGTAVTITGTNFASGATVTFGAAAATNVSVVNSTTITATTPAGTAGAVTVTVTVNGPSGSLANGFTYNGSGGNTFSDNFNRANGPLGSNWTTPSSTSPATFPLQIINNQVLAASTPVIHALEYYNAGTFANNQWASETVVNAPTNGNSAQAILVRGSNTNYYNDGIPFQSGYFVGPANQNDFCRVGHIGSYVNGDSHALYVAGSGPVFFWSFRNNVIDATCDDTVNNITGGGAGIGMASDQNATPTMAATNWQGGSLDSFSSTASDNFTRANAGWLGVNWWFTPIDPGGAGSVNAFYKLANNAAVLSTTGNSQFGAAIWTTALTGNQSVVAIGAYGSSADFAGPVVRYSMPDGNNVNSTTTFYLAEAQSNGQVEIFEYSGGTFNLLSNLGTFGGTVSTLELDASGTSPVTLTVKVNGSTFGSPVTDSTYKLKGSYVGFTTFGTSSTTVIGWSGN